MGLHWLRSALAAAGCLGVMSAASLAAGTASAPNPAPTAPPLVYVTDFELDVADVEPDSGPGSRARRLAGGILPRGPLHSQQDPQAHAREIVSQMSEQLTADLTKAGIDARRLPPGAPVPPSGYRVRGVFLNVDEGNRLRRAVVGFGAGQNDLQVAVSLDDLSSPQQGPLYESVEESTSRDKPGAIVKLNPYVIAAKFVLDGRDEHSTIERAAAQISETVAGRLRAVPPR